MPPGAQMACADTRSSSTVGPSWDMSHPSPLPQQLAPWLGMTGARRAAAGLTGAMSSQARWADRWGNVTSGMRLTVLSVSSTSIRTTYVYSWLATVQRMLLLWLVACANGEAIGPCGLSMGGRCFRMDHGGRRFTVSCHM